MNNDFNLDYVEFYEDDFLLHPEEFKILLNDMHKEFELSDVKPLLEYAEELEAYEICRVIIDFENEHIKK